MHPRTSRPGRAGSAPVTGPTGKSRTYRLKGEMLALPRPPDGGRGTPKQGAFAKMACPPGQAKLAAERGSHEGLGVQCTRHCPLQPVERGLGDEAARGKARGNATRRCGGQCGGQPGGTRQGTRQRHSAVRRAVRRAAGPKPPSKKSG